MIYSGTEAFFGSLLVVETSPSRPGRREGRALAIAVYVALFVLAVAEGTVGSFQYGRSPVPLVAIGLDILVLATCVFAAWGTGSFGGSLVVVAGWLLASFILSMGTPTGSVIITNTTAGKWYLYGGTLAALLGAVAVYVFRARFRRPPAR
jgi:hypothetical protein